MKSADLHCQGKINRLGVWVSGQNTNLDLCRKGHKDENQAPPRSAIPRDAHYDKKVERGEAELICRKVIRSDDQYKCHKANDEYFRLTRHIDVISCQPIEHPNYLSHKLAFSEPMLC